jgi:hypothetical protein
MSRIDRRFLDLPMRGYPENFFHLFSWAGYAENFALQIVMISRDKNVIDWEH